MYNGKLREIGDYELNEEQVMEKDTVSLLDRIKA
jgi:hypothetical protein